MMPPQPAPDCIVIPPQPPLTLLEGGCDRPAHPGHPHQRRDWRVCGRVAEIDLEFWVLSPSTPTDPLHVWARQAGAHRHAALEGKRSPQGPLAAFCDQGGRPLVQRDSRRELIAPPRRRFSGDQTGLAGPSAQARPGRHRRDWGGAARPACRGARRQHTSATIPSRNAPSRPKSSSHVSPRNRRPPSVTMACTISRASACVVLQSVSAGMPHVPHRSR
jgi:hypothetical protein